MSDDVFIHNNREDESEAMICPLIKKRCLKDKCQWWVTDYMEDRGKYRSDCAVAMVAKALTDEALLAMQAGKKTL